jgi:undecaprenyl diphosphate synthase
MPKQIFLPKGTVVPDHIAMVLDGNRRWARARGLEPWQGHYQGFKAVEKLAEASRKLGVHTFTVWAFSTENWDRPQKEIDAIMDIFRHALKEKEKEFHRDRVALVHLGRKDRLPLDIRRELTRIESETAKYINHNVFNLAVDYGGRDEIVRAVQKIVIDKIPANKIDDKTFEKYLDTHGQPYPNPDLFIRTSGEQRTSGLLPWQMVYSEFYFETAHLPDFTPEKLKEAILDFSRRRRRFGGQDVVGHLSFDPKVTAKLELSWWRLRNIPEGMAFKDYVVKHIKEQFGLSTILALQAAGLLMEAIVEENARKFDRAKIKMKKFYELVRDELKLAFEPKIVASLEVEMDKELGDKQSLEGTFEAEETAKLFYAEVYRISLFQAAKAAHLRVLAAVERNLAEAGMGDEHWARAEDYLQRFYFALKERVA